MPAPTPPPQPPWPCPYGHGQRPRPAGLSVGSPTSAAIPKEGGSLGDFKEGGSPQAPLDASPPSGSPRAFFLSFPFWIACTQSVSWGSSLGMARCGHGVVLTPLRRPSAGPLRRGHTPVATSPGGLYLCRPDVATTRHRGLTSPRLPPSSPSRCPRPTSLFALRRASPPVPLST